MPGVPSPAASAAGRLQCRDAAAVDPAHLARADADRGAALHIDDGVRLHVLGDGEGEDEVGGLGRRRRASGDDFQVAGAGSGGVARLHQQAARERAERDAARRRVRQAAGHQQAQVFLLRDDPPRRLVGVGGDDHLGEDLGDARRRGRVEGAVQRDDAAEGAHRIAGERTGVGGGEVARQGHAAGIGVLDDGDGGRLFRRELGHQLVGRVGVVQIVVAERLALHLDRRGDARARRARGIEGRLLVRVFAVAQQPAPLARDDQLLGQRVARLTSEPAADGRVVGAGRGIGLGRQFVAEREARGAVVRRHFRQHADLVGGVDQHHHMGMVLRRRTQHRRPADVDIFDAGLGVGAGGDSGLEGVEVDRHEVDAADPVRFHRLDVRRVVAPGQDGAVHHGMQGLDPPVHHFGKAGEVAYLAYRDTGLGDRLGRAAGGDDFDAVPGERAGELGEPALVGHRDQGAADGDQVVRGHERLRGGNRGSPEPITCPVTPPRRPAWRGLGIPPSARLSARRPASRSAPSRGRSRESCRGSRRCGRR